MAKRRDTAQLIAEASKLLSSESDAQKYAGLSFLNAVASDPGGSLRKEAVDIISDFIMSSTDVTIEDQVRMRAIHCADDLVGNNPGNFEIKEFIQISSSHNRPDYLECIKIKNLYAVYIGFKINKTSLLEEIQLKRSNQFAFIGCTFNGVVPDKKIIDINNISAWNCKFKYYRIKKLNPLIFVKVYDQKTKEYDRIFYVSNRNWDKGIFKTNKFVKCDFSDCLSWDQIKFSLLVLRGIEEAFDRCYYYSGHEPLSFDKEQDGAFLMEITSKEQFEELFGKDELPYSPPNDKN